MKNWKIKNRKCRNEKLSLRIVTFNFPLSILSLLILAACTRADIHYPVVTWSEGVVQICPDMSAHTLPAVQYHFYNIDGETEYIVRACDGSGNFEGKLPVGTYRVIATNTAASNVVFTNMDNYELATVYAKSRDTRTAWQFGRSRSALNFLEQPDNVYSAIIDELVVTEDGVARKEPVPVLLTKQLNLVFSMQSGLDEEVAAMSGVLSGVYPAVHLHNGQGVQIEQSPNDLGIRFDTEQSGSEHKALVSLFGLYNPEGGQAYTNILELELTMTDGSTVQTTLDLTAILSDVIEKNEGTLPLEFSMPIKVEKTSIGVGAEVGEWVYEGEGGMIEN